MLQFFWASRNEKIFKFKKYERGPEVVLIMIRKLSGLVLQPHSTCLNGSMYQLAPSRLLDLAARPPIDPVHQYHW